MPLTDTVWIDTDLSPQEALSLFLEGIGYHAKIHEHQYRPRSIWHYAEIPEFTARAETLSIPDVRSDTLQISSKIEMRIHPNLEIRWDQPKDALIRATLAFIQRTGADIALELMDAEVIVLIHKSGHLMIDETTTIWTPERLAMIHIPYEVKNLQPDEIEPPGLWKWLRRFFYHR